MMRPPTQVRPRSSQPGKGKIGKASPPTAKVTERHPRKAPTPRQQRQTQRLERPPRTGSTLSSEDGVSAASSMVERPAVPRAKDGKDERVNVCVRVRPMSETELSEGFSEVVDCDLDNPGTIEITRSLRANDARKKETFSFDTVLPSSAGQAAMYNLIGRPVFDRLTDGYNSCVIAFGATGCGKSHTIFGTNQDRGLLPRISETIFQNWNMEAGQQMLVKVSYLELYNEKARDLLKPEDPDNGKAASLEVREHPKAGIFVEGLTRSVASNAEEVLRLVDFGHKIRVVGSTNMNAHSSRSHAIVTLHLEVLDSNGASGHRQMVCHSQLHAVDLAGSERLFMVGNDSLRRRESMQINKSLLALGQMISKLSKGVEGSHIPYRNSKLTFLLADSLMGNCKTAVIACISPSSSYQQLTDSTLRFASSVKEIKTKPVQNQEPAGDLVQTLRNEVAMIRKRLRQGIYDQSQAREMEAQLRGDEYLQDQFSSSYEEMQVKAKTAEGLRRRTLRRLGLCQSVGQVEKAGSNFIVVQKISLDPLLSGRLTWTMSPGEQLRIGSEPDCEIVVDGLGVEAEMCRLHCLNANEIEVLPGSQTFPLEEEGKESLHRRGSLYKRYSSTLVMVNSVVLQEPQILRCGDFLRVGRSHFFRVNDGEATLNRSQDAKQAMERAFGINGFTKDAELLRERLGAQRGDEVIRDLKDLKLVVEEANELTVELRGSDDLSFKGRVLMDPLDNEEPAVVVSLMERQDADGSCYLTERSPAIATWTLAEFQQRLEVMRDIYDEVRLRDLPWGQPGDLDPWHARDRIPVITSRGSPHSSYPGSPARHGETPRAIPCPEPSLSTCPVAPVAAPERDAGAAGASEPTSPGSVATILQQLPLLQAELAKAHETQGQQAHQLHSVRRELEDLRQSMSLQKMSTSPARRPSDAGNVTPPSEAASRARQLSAPVIPAASHGNDAAANKLRARLSPPRWQGARAASPPEAATFSPSNSQALGTPQSQKEDPALSNLSGLSSVVHGSEDRSTQLSHKMDGISCYAPARSLAESAGCVPFQLQPTMPDASAIRRQFSAPVSRVRSHVPSRQSAPGTTQLRPVSTVLPVHQLTPRTPLVTPLGMAGWQPPSTGGSFLLAGHSTPRMVTQPQAAPMVAPLVPQVANPLAYLTPSTPRKVPMMTARPSVRPDSPSPMENAMKVARAAAMANSAQTAASAPNTPRYRSEPVTAESFNAMAAAAKAAAQAAPGMNIVVRPISTAEMALLKQDGRQSARSLPSESNQMVNDAPLQVSASAVRGDQLRSCQVELADLRKEVDALGQVCRGLTLFEGSPSRSHFA